MNLGIASPSSVDRRLAQELAALMRYDERAGAEFDTAHEKIFGAP
jgi:hypothetical protein